MMNVQRKRYVDAVKKKGETIIMMSNHHWRWSIEMTRTMRPGSKMIASNLAHPSLQRRTLVSKRTRSKSTTSVSVIDLEGGTVTRSKATRIIEDEMLKEGLPVEAEREAKNPGADLSQLTVAAIVADEDPRDAGCAMMNIATTGTAHTVTRSTL
eukprot:1148913-Rhodomonas_salina.1